MPGALEGGSYPGENHRASRLGGVLGGALVESELFYFLSYEYQNYGGSRLGHFAVPAESERGLRVNPELDLDGDGMPDGVVPISDLARFFEERSIPYSAAAGEGVFSLYPLPNNGQGPFGTNTYSQVRPNRGSGHMLSAKIDWEISTQDTFTARHNFTDDESVIPFTGDSINSSLGTDTRTQNMSTYLNTVRTSFANLARFSYGRTRLGFPPDRGSPLLFGSPPSGDLPPEVSQVIETPYGLFGPFGATGPVGQVGILPYSSVGIDVFNFPQGRVDNTFQLADNLIWIRGNHNLQFGFDIRHYQLTSFADRNSRPAFVFGSGLVAPACAANPGCPFATEDGLLRGTDLASLGAPAGVLQSLSTGPVADTTIGLRFTHYDFFVQDEWRVLPNLTVNLGLRYELGTVPQEHNRRIEEIFGLTSDQFPHLDPADFSGADAQVVTLGNTSFDAAFAGWQDFLGGRERIYQPDRNNLAPRIGFAWDPFGNGKTAIRAGYGIFFDSNLGAVTSQSRNVFPTFVPVNLDPNFNPPTGEVLNSPIFLVFTPTDEPLVRPGTLNSYNLSGDAFATGLGTLFAQAPPLPGGSLSSNGLAFTLPEDVLETPYGQHWLIALQRDMRSFLLSVNYVGTRGLHLPRFTTPNLGVVTTPVLIFPLPGVRPLVVLDLPPGATSTSFGRPQTNLGAFTVFENSASSRALLHGSGRRWNSPFPKR